MIVHATSPYTDPKYRCCCQSCHVTTGTRIIGVLQAVGLVCGLISNIKNYAEHGSSYSSLFAGSLLSTLFWTLALVCLFWGLKTERAGLLLPHLCGQIVTMVLVVVIWIALIVCLVAYQGLLSSMLTSAMKSDQSNLSSQDIQDVEQAVTTYVVIFGVILLVALLLGFALELWFFMVVLKCYRFLKDGEHHRNYLMTLPTIKEKPDQMPYYA